MVWEYAPRVPVVSINALSLSTGGAYSSLRIGGKSLAGPSVDLPLNFAVAPATTTSDRTYRSSFRLQPIAISRRTLHLPFSGPSSRVFPVLPIPFPGAHAHRLALQPFLGPPIFCISQRACLKHDLRLSTPSETECFVYSAVYSFIIVFSLIVVAKAVEGRTGKPFSSLSRRLP